MKTEDTKANSLIQFETKLFKVNDSIILLLPKSASALLPSRGIVMVEGTVNGFKFNAVLEPDGIGSHWFRISKQIQSGAKVKIGDTVKVTLKSSDKWIEPNVPDDINKALKESPKILEIWKSISPIARWDWIRWIVSTKNPETRKKRIEVTFSKFRAGKRRACCFNRSMCTDMSVSDKGLLLNPTK